MVTIHTTERMGGARRGWGGVMACHHPRTASSMWACSCLAAPMRVGAWAPRLSWNPGFATLSLIALKPDHVIQFILMQARHRRHMAKFAPHKLSTLAITHFAEQPIINPTVPCSVWIDRNAFSPRCLTRQKHLDMFADVRFLQFSKCGHSRTFCISPCPQIAASAVTIWSTRKPSLPALEIVKYQPSVRGFVTTGPNTRV